MIFKSAGSRWFNGSTLIARHLFDLAVLRHDVIVAIKVCQICCGS